MDYTHYAAIDIGSNAVRLLVKRLDDPSKGRFSKDVMLRVPLRLGQEVFTSGAVSERKSYELREVMKAFKIVMGIYNIERENYRACATAALREAVNSQALIDAIKEDTGLEIEVISGHEEATIVSGLHTKGDLRTLVYVDVGGGSTEVSIVSGGKSYGRRSFPIGTVKIINNVAPPNWRDMVREFLREMAADALGCPTSQVSMPDAAIVGSGGNINKLFNMAHERDAAENTMSVSSLRMLFEALAPLSVEQRMVAHKLKADRADVIVPAAEIFLTIADALGIQEIDIPANGLSDGIISQMWQAKREAEAATPQKD